MIPNEIETFVRRLMDMLVKYRKLFAIEGDSLKVSGVECLPCGGGFYFRYNDGRKIGLTYLREILLVQCRQGDTQYFTYVQPKDQSVAQEIYNRVMSEAG